METSTRNSLCHQINVFLQKFPDASTFQIKEFILKGSQGDVNLSGVSQNTLKKFILYQKNKVTMSGSCIKRLQGSGRHKSVSGSKKIVSKVVKSFSGKATPGQRAVALKLGISQMSVSHILKEQGIQCYHKVREQSMSKKHMVDRVKFGKWFLQNFGSDGTKGKWLKFVNTDFSAYVRTEPHHNTKNDVVYSKDKSDIRELLANKEKKFAPGVMLWGGISSKGLVPPSAPLFVDEVLSPWTRDGEKVKNVNGEIYADMLETIVQPAVMELYPGGDSWFQDDEAKIHRTPAVLDKVDALFNHRVPPKMACCTADLYPIENIWSILKAEVSKKAPIENTTQLKKIITTKWRELHRDKELMKRMIASVPRRIEAMIKLKGAQVHKADYAGPQGDN